MEVTLQQTSIPTNPMEGPWKLQGGGGSKQQKFLKETMKPNWTFQGGGGGVSNQETFQGG